MKPEIINGELWQDVLFADTLQNGTEVDYNFHLNTFISSIPWSSSKNVLLFRKSIVKQREFPIRNKKDTVNLLLPGNRLKTRLFALHLPQIKYQEMVVTETRIKPFIWIAKWGYTLCNENKSDWFDNKDQFCQ